MDRVAENRHAVRPQSAADLDQREDQMIKNATSKFPAA